MLLHVGAARTGQSATKAGRAPLWRAADAAELLQLLLASAEDKWVLATGADERDVRGRGTRH
jgi:hypothetical protein